MSECLGTETLVDFVEGRGDAEIRARVEQHASHCEDCRAVLSSLARGSTTAKMPVGTPTRPSDPALALTADMTVGRYIIQRALGAGGMGVVYAARDPELDRVVAVKVLRGDGGPSMQQRLRREAKAMAQLAHPNVVAVYDVGAIGERIFIAMEYIEGETLAQWLKTRRTLRAILEAYRDAGRGLAVAHAAGIVHRDFKPENVLVGNDGRVRVVDFGLARNAAVAEPSSMFRTGGHTPISPDGPTELANLTQTGAMVGTPYYMAPELYDGAAGDARSDQFSLCVALFTALYGRRPFDGDTVETLADNTRAGRIHEPASGVPRRIRAAIRRGLSVDPAARFASIDELLVAIEPPSRLRVLIPIATLVVFGVIAGMVKLSFSTDAIDQRCTGAAAAFAGAWNPERRAVIDKAFGTSHLPYAPVAAHEVDAALDRYAESWISAHTEACRATQVRGEQTDAMLDRRMLCLARRKQEATALVDALALADDAVVGRSVVAAGTLPDVATCADVTALSQIVAPPSDPATRAKIDALTSQLADARARFQTGRYPAALELATKIAADARAIAYRPFEAEADLLQGQIERAMGREQAKASFEAAELAAEAGRHDEVAARAWAALVFVVGYEGADYKRGAELAQRASAAIARLGGNADIEASLEQGLGAMAADQEKADEAVVHFEKAVALEETSVGKDHPSVAGALDNLGMAVNAQGHPDRAIALQMRALHIREAHLGADHPTVAQSLHNLGNIHAQIGNYALAEAEERRALAIRRASLDPNHPDIAGTLSDLARVVRNQGRGDEALALDREAVAIGEKAFGPTNPTFAQQLVNLAINLSRLGNHAEATQQFTRAEDILTKLNGADHPSVAFVRLSRGDDLMRQSKWREAAALYERILPVLATAQGSGQALTAARTNLALAYLELHQARRALPIIELTANASREAMSPANAGSVDFIHARALWDSGGDRKHAHELAVTARTELASSPDDVKEIDAWLAKH